MAKVIAEQLVARGHEVRVQTAGMRHLPTRETTNGVEVFRTHSFRRREDRCSVPEMGLFCATSFRPTLRHCREWKPDVIHAHFAMPTGLLAWAVHRQTRVPYVLTAHLGDVPGGVPEQTDRLFRLVDPLAQKVWRQAVAATAVSSFVQELAERAYGRKVARILNGIDMSDSPPAPTSIAHPRRLVFIGRLNQQKCPLFLIEVLAGLEGSDWHMTLIGDGTLMEATRRHADAHGVASRIEFTGWLPGADVQQRLAGADLLLMPSSFEGLPVAAIEALKYGVAIAVSDIPGVRDVVTDGRNGLRLAVGDKASWIAGVNSLLADEPRLLAMKKASHEHARIFDLRHIAVEYESVLESAVHGSQARPTSAFAHPT